MRIVNEHDGLQTEQYLWMIHADDLVENEEEYIENAENAPKFRADDSARFNAFKHNHPLDGIIYRRGGVVINVALDNATYTDEEACKSVMICDGATCEVCWPDSADPGPEPRPGWPFVHASSLHKNPPLNSFYTDRGAPFFREEVTPPQNLVVPSGVKKSVNYEYGIGRMIFFAVTSVVCIPEECPYCSQIRVETRSPTPDSDTSMESDSPSPPPDQDSDRYHPSGIKDSRRDSFTGRFRYLLSWREFAADGVTWEPISIAVKIDHDQIRKFHEDNPTCERPSEEEAAEYGIEHLLNRPGRDEEDGEDLPMADGDLTGEEMYNVAAVVGSRRQGRDFLYTIIWEGYTGTTEESIETLLSCEYGPMFIWVFHHANPDQPRPSARMRREFDLMIPDRPRTWGPGAT